MDSCGDVGASLWSPETSNEIAFVKSTYPSSSRFYHLGIEQYVHTKGVIFSDNSFGVGLPFYTGNTKAYLLIKKTVKISCTIEKSKNPWDFPMLKLIHGFGF